tara:strand:- start:158 stop:397 length:240 start_codon:yes stop_codon:yes gene_type:complete
MSIPKKNTAGKKKIVDKQKDLLVAAADDVGFKNYLFDEGVLTINEYNDLMNDPRPNTRQMMIKLYKNYLKGSPAEVIPF